MPRKRKPQWTADDFQPTAETQYDDLLQTTAAPTRGRQARKRVTRVPVGQIWPDPYQPRPLLPPEIKRDFFAGVLNCFEAARAWLALAEQDPAEAERVQALLQMGASFTEHGQIKPITGHWDAETRRFILETGERRFWAAVLQAVQQGLPEEPQLEALVVETPSRARQVLENITAEPPSAVMRAREIAALVLEQMGIYPDPGESDFAYYRRAAAIKRLPSRVVRHVEALLGMSRRYIRYYLQILNLPDHLLLLADRYRLTEGALREVLKLEPAAWEDAIQALIAAQQLGSETTSAPADEAPSTTPARPRPKRAQLDPRISIARRMRTPVRSLLRLEADDVPKVAEHFAAELGDPQMVQQAADALEALATQLRTLAKASATPPKAKKSARR